MSYSVANILILEAKKTVVPLRDDNPTTITPYVTYGLIAANILVFLYELSLADRQLTEFFYSWAVVPCQLSNMCRVSLPVSPLDRKSVV